MRSLPKSRLVTSALFVTALGAGSLLACSAIIGTRDLEYAPDASNGASSSSSSSSGGSSSGASSGTTSSSGGEGGNCVADFNTDPKHCGRCNHDCFGGACNAGKCEAVEIGAVSGGPLRQITVGATHVFVASIINYTTETGGLWRIPKGGGQAEQYVTYRYAEASVILGSTLYFIVDDDPEGSAADKHGGLWSCPVAGPAPCTPTLIAAATTPRAIAVDKTRVLYGDDTTGKGLMVFQPPTTPTVYRADFGFITSLFVDGSFTAYGVSFYSGPPRATLFEILGDGGVNELYRYEHANASQGDLVGTSDAVYFTAADWGTSAGATSDGRVRRVPRPGSAALPCDFGGTTNKRPYGVWVDAARVYWTNMGEGTAQPWTNGSLQTCELTGCCAQGTTLWTGDGEPSGVAGDESSVYWVSNKSGSVRRIAKP